MSVYKVVLCPAFHSLRLRTEAAAIVAPAIAEVPPSVVAPSTQRMMPATMEITPYGMLIQKSWRKACPLWASLPCGAADDDADAYRQHPGLLLKRQLELCINQLLWHTLASAILT